MSWSRFASNDSSSYDYIINHEYYDSNRSYGDTCPLVRFAHTMDNFIDFITPENDVFLNTTISFNLFISTLLIIFIILFLFSIILTSIHTITRQFNLTSFIQRFLLVIENEFIAPKTFLIILTLLTTTFLLGGLSPIFSLKTPGLTYLLISIFSIFLLMILLWPISLIYNWGTYFTIYIKGESTMGNLLGQVVMDYFYVVSFFLRINLQFLRLVVLSGVFIVYNEFYFEFIYPVYNFELNSITITNWTDYTLIGIKMILTIIFRFIYELGHMWVVLIMQANAFAMILFLILQSLHTVYLFHKLQNFFKYKKNN